jgi:hypothetical protein
VHFLSATTIQQQELPSQLEIRVIRSTGLVEIIAEVALSSFFIWMAWHEKNWFFFLVFLFASLVIISNWLRGQLTTLIATAPGLTASGNLNNLTRTTISVSSSDIDFLGYSKPRKHATPGLYANRTLLLPFINSKQCEEIIAAIQTKFPEFRSIANTYGTASDLIGLKLN